MGARHFIFVLLCNLPSVAATLFVAEWQSANWVIFSVNEFGTLRSLTRSLETFPGSSKHSSGSGFLCP